MNGAHYHLLFNHLPIIIPIVGFLVMIAGFIFRSQIVKLVAYGIFVLGALGTIPAFFTGEDAEEVVEKVQGIDKDFIHEHEEVAETFAILGYILGGFALFGFWTNWKQKSYSNVVAIATTIFCVVVLYFAQQTGTSGGEIRHTEIRSGNTATNPVGEESE